MLYSDWHPRYELPSLKRKHCAVNVGIYTALRGETRTYLRGQGALMLHRVLPVVVGAVAEVDVGWAPAAGPAAVDAAVGARCRVSAMPCRIFASPTSVSAWCPPVPVAESTKSRMPPRSLSPAPIRRSIKRAQVGRCEVRYMPSAVFHAPLRMVLVHCFAILLFIWSSPDFLAEVFASVVAARVGHDDRRPK